MENLNIKTERLTLKPLSSGDIDFFVKIKTDPKIMQYTPPVSIEAKIRDGFAQRLGESIWDGFTGEWVIYITDTQQPIGTMGLFELPESDPEKEPVINTGEIELGYRSVVDAWGKGYITEAASAFLDFVFQNGDLSQLVACTHPDNKASMNVLRKIGLKDCDQKYCYGKFLPYFEITRAQWASLRDMK